MNLLHEQFNRDGYVVMPGLFDVQTCQILSRYMRFKAEARPNIRRGSDTLANIHREYGDALVELYFDQVCRQGKLVTLLDLMPALSFYYTYFHKNELTKHRDRASCQYNITVCTGFESEDADGKTQTWPIYLENKEKPNQPIAIHLNVGDGLLFQGHNTTHWREPFPGQWMTQVMYSFVDANGPFSHLKYDQRDKLGQPHIGMFNWTARHLYHQMLNRWRR